MRQRRAAIAATALAAVFGCVLALAQPRPPAVTALPPAPASSDPLDLFSAMMPVFTHARCANCHGAVDPHAESGPLADTHDGGIVAPGGTCADSGCHSQTDDSHDETRWQTASPSHNFNGRSARQLCDMQSGVADGMNSSRTDGYFQHLSTDFLIDLAFVGQSGGASNSADPPPMSKDAFLEAARAWLDGGNKCSAWTGSITQQETFASLYAFPLGGAGSGIEVSVNEQAQRIFTLDRANGVSQVRINQGGRQTMITEMRQDGCVTTITSISDWQGQNAAPAPGDVTIRIARDGSYTIRFVGPPEQTVTNDSGRASSTCAPPPAPTADATPLEWDPWKMTIRCPANFTQDPASGNTIDCDLFDPKHNPRLKGTMVRTLRNHEDAADPQSWMAVSPVGNSRADDGSSIPITVVTTWDFTLPP